MTESLPPKPPVKPKAIQKPKEVRVIILAWAGAILTLNYVSVPWLPQKQIDPTFIASIFTGTLATFGVNPTKKKEEKEDKDLPKKEK